MSYYGRLTPLAEVKKGRIRGKLSINECGQVVLQVWPGQTLDSEAIGLHLGDFPSFKMGAVNSATTTLYETEESKLTAEDLEPYAKEQLTGLVTFLDRVRSGTL